MRDIIFAYTKMKHRNLKKNTHSKDKILPTARTESNSSSCKVVCFDINKVNKVKSLLPSENELEELIRLYTALGNITRLKIIFALAKGELCVCDIANVLGLSIPATSHQLKHLYGKKILKYRNDGKMVYYSLNSSHLVSILKKDVRFIENELVG
jgi:ArsR family transcriptional regulator, lead/cadmium/zinc/bismuth-responsive transcriptional repressor